MIQCEPTCNPLCLQILDLFEDSRDELVQWVRWAEDEASSYFDVREPWECLQRSTRPAQAAECMPDVQDRYADTNMLDISDVELHDLQLFEGDPVVVVRFNAQQINCFRDKFENVVDGSPDDVHRVVYVWALRQGKAGFVGKDGRLYPPQWQINEMAIGIAQKLL